MMGVWVLVLLSLFSRQRFSADITDSCFIEHSNTTSITAQDAFWKIGLFLSLHPTPTPTAIEAFFWVLPSTARAGERRQRFMAMRATHLILLLNFEAFDKTINLAFISLQFMEKLLGPFIREETIEVILLPGEKGIEIDLLSLLFLGNVFRGLIFFLFHENPSLYRTAHPFCQPCVLVHYI